MINRDQAANRSLQFAHTIVNSRIFWIITFAVFTGIAAQFAIPVKPIPFTLQTMIVLLSGAFLGSRNGPLSQILYLSLGILGLPIFAQVPDAPMGIARLLGPTGGYLLAFPLASFLVGYLIEKNQKYYFIVAAMFFAEILIIAFGIFHFAAFYTKNLMEAFKFGAAIFTFWTIVKVFIAAFMYSFISGVRKR